MDFKKWSMELLDNCEQKVSDNEWYFSNSRDGLVKNLRPFEAFDLLPDAVQLVLDQNDEYLAYQTFLILQLLYSVVDTTEMPKYLVDNWSNLEKHMNKFHDHHRRLLNELKQYLHIK